MPGRNKNSRYSDLQDVFSYALLLGLVYCALYLAIGDVFAYGGPVWSTVVIWLAAQLGAFFFQLLRLPSLLGMLVSGIVVNNAVPQIISGLPRDWSAGFRAAALCTIFLRSGLELDLKIFNRVGPAAIRLLLIPGLTEAFVAGAASIGILRLPPFFAFTLGFILKAVGPAVVIQTMFEVQKGGYGVAKGIPSIIVAAASFDDMVALTGYSLFSNLAISNQKGSLALKMAHGPIDIALGVVAGFVGAVFCSATKIWNTRLKRIAAVFFTSMSLLFLLYKFDYRTAGALAALVMGLVVNVLWERGINCFGLPGYLANGPGPLYGADVEHVVGAFWRQVAQPMLFGIIGTLINFKAISTGFIPRAIAVIFLGLAVRIPTTFMAMTGAGLTTKERIFVAMAWTPKATVQAALAAAPLDAILISQGPDHPDVQYGEAILTTSVFAILICAPLGVSLIHYFAPVLLEKYELGIKKTSAGGGAAGSGSQGGDSAQRTPHISTSPADTPPLSPTWRHASSGLTNDVDASRSSSAASSPRWRPKAGPGTSSTCQRPASTFAFSRAASAPATPELSLQLAAIADPSPPPTGKALLLGRPQQRSPQLPLSRPAADVEAAAQPAAGASEGEVEAALQLAFEQRTLERSDSTLGQYLASMEQLAGVVEQARPSGADGSETAAQLRELVAALRRKLLQDSQLLVDSEEQLESAKQFFKLTQSIQTLPEVGAALESLPSYMRGGAAV